MDGDQITIKKRAFFSDRVQNLHCFSQPLLFVPPTLSWLPPGRYTRSIAAKSLINVPESVEVIRANGPVFTLGSEFTVTLFRKKV